jgi:nucleotide-binding universal stress UspA family protein
VTHGPIESIFHPSDFSGASRVAFEHALKLAVMLKAELRVMHVAGGGGVDWTEFPGVRETLHRWGLIPDDSPRMSVGRLGIRVEKIIAHDDDPVRACVAALSRTPADLIVLATSQHAGRMAWLNRSVAEPIARAAHAMTLFIPHGAPGFVDSATGAVTLRSVLVPVAATPSPAGAFRAVTHFTRAVGPDHGVVTTLHVGGGEARSDTRPEAHAWTWNQLNREGPVVETILQAAADVEAGLIAMTTQGRHGFLDLLRGSTTERVLRGAACPVLAVPAGG